MSTEPQGLLHITHARQDEDWVQGVLVPALGLSDDQVWTCDEADPGALKLEALEALVGGYAADISELPLDGRPLADWEAVLARTPYVLVNDALALRRVLAPPSLPR